MYGCTVSSLFLSVDADSFWFNCGLANADVYVEGDVDVEGEVGWGWIDYGGC